MTVTQKLLAVAVMLGVLFAFSAAADASSTPRRLLLPALPTRSCAGLLTVADLPDAEKAEPPSVEPLAAETVSTCQFPPLVTPTETHVLAHDSLGVLHGNHYYPGKHRSAIWPGGFTRFVLKGVGTVAEYGYSATEGFGYLQDRNDNFIVQSEGVSIIELLRKVSGELCPSC